VSRPVGIALVGTGFAVRTQLPAFRVVPGAEVRALVGRDAGRTADIARRSGIPFATDRLDAVLARPDIEVVCIATPPDLHAPMAAAALRAGKHVLCEKPLALDAGTAVALCRTARQHPDRLALVDHQLRFTPTLRRLRRLVADGYVGTPLHVGATLLVARWLDRGRPFTWWQESARGGGALGAFGSHLVDWLRWTFGEVDAVRATLATCIASRAQAAELRPRRVDSDDYAALWLRCGGASPLQASVLLSAVAHRGGGLGIDVFGTEGTLRFDADARLWGSRREALGPHAVEEPPFEELTQPEPLPEAARKTLPDTLWARAFASMAQDLVAAVEEGRTQIPEAATFEDGLHVQRVLDAAQVSSEKGSWVEPGALGRAGR
jgi:predicted dehydrogenase